MASPASPGVLRYSSTTSLTRIWGILKCLAINLEKWVFPEAVGPWIKILLGLNPLNSLNSWQTLIIFLGRPSLQCQLNYIFKNNNYFTFIIIIINIFTLNLGGASGFSSSCSSWASSSSVVSKILEGLNLKSRLNMSKLGFSRAPSAKDTCLVFPDPTPPEIASINFF